MTNTGTPAPRTYLPVSAAFDVTHTDIRRILREEGLRGRALILAVDQVANHIVAMRENEEYRAAYRAGHTLNCSGAHSTFTCH